MSQQQHADPAFRPPQQARSRKSLHKVLTAAERVLATGGIEEFTVAAVAERAGVSVGAIYRRFTGKEQLLHAVKDQLLGQLETGVAEALGSAEPGLDGVVGAFTHAMAHTFSQHDRVFPDLLSGQRAEGVERGLRALAVIQEALVEAAEPYGDDIRGADRGRALRMAARTIISSCVHRAATCRSWPDGLSWAEWADETTEMAMAYLTPSPAATRQ
ncbi:TetR/AcrR family transcriptional regulator [Allokutzneria sp. A3M-2-11 16]|uniref:TetR/AcrR family transcriptional regulator n=1 Tax=Allokutzneria sp. A3M-2-11 16 TaxID=2962043 RepID=UPI0020B803EA|nr:TetR/AcrR family transcriptional regulator [Allokutzneria sp. A3M-2-11 16]MCP3803774.1 TetR/AcrR family transcriptional regulator [Allokutzneria sp. A3M-2-11 16]